MYEGEGDAHGGDPGGEDDGVSVLVAPVFCALREGFRFFDLGAELFLRVEVHVAFGHVSGFVAAGGPVSSDDGYALLSVS